MSTAHSERQRLASYNAQRFIEGGRFGGISPLTGRAPTWRMGSEDTPIYSSMLADGFASPWLDAPGGPCVLVPAEVLRPDDANGSCPPDAPHGPLGDSQTPSGHPGTQPGVRTPQRPA
jgi:hypothetical protein